MNPSPSALLHLDYLHRGLKESSQLQINEFDSRAQIHFDWLDKFREASNKGNYVPSTPCRGKSLDQPAITPLKGFNYKPSADRIALAPVNLNTASQFETPKEKRISRRSTARQMPALPPAPTLRNGTVLVTASNGSENQNPLTEEDRADISEALKQLQTINPKNRVLRPKREFKRTTSKIPVVSGLPSSTKGSTVSEPNESQTEEKIEPIEQIENIEVVQKVEAVQEAGVADEKQEMIEEVQLAVSDISPLMEETQVQEIVQSEPIQDVEPSTEVVKDVEEMEDTEVVHENEVEVPMENEVKVVDTEEVTVVKNEEMIVENEEMVVENEEMVVENEESKIVAEVAPESPIKENVLPQEPSADQEPFVADSADASVSVPVVPALNFVAIVQDCVEELPKMEMNEGESNVVQSDAAQEAIPVEQEEVSNNELVQEVTQAMNNKRQGRAKRTRAKKVEAVKEVVIVTRPSADPTVGFDFGALDGAICSAFSPRDGQVTTDEVASTLEVAALTSTDEIETSLNQPMEKPKRGRPARGGARAAQKQAAPIEEEEVVATIEVQEEPSEVDVVVEEEVLPKRPTRSTRARTAPVPPARSTRGRRGKVVEEITNTEETTTEETVTEETEDAKLMNTQQEDETEEVMVKNFKKRPRSAEVTLSAQRKTQIEEEIPESKNDIEAEELKSTQEEAVQVEIVPENEEMSAPAPKRRCTGEFESSELPTAPLMETINVQQEENVDVLFKENVDDEQEEQDEVMTVVMDNTGTPGSSSTTDSPKYLAISEDPVVVGMVDTSSGIAVRSEECELVEKVVEVEFNRCSASPIPFASKVECRLNFEPLKSSEASTEVLEQFVPVENAESETLQEVSEVDIKMDQDLPAEMKPSIVESKPDVLVNKDSIINAAPMLSSSLPTQTPSKRASSILHKLDTGRSSSASSLSTTAPPARSNSSSVYSLSSSRAGIPAYKAAAASKLNEKIAKIQENKAELDAKRKAEMEEKLAKNARKVQERLENTKKKLAEKPVKPVIVASSSTVGLTSSVVASTLSSSVGLTSSVVTPTSSESMSKSGSAVSVSSETSNTSNTSNASKSKPKPSATTQYDSMFASGTLSSKIEQLLMPMEASTMEVEESTSPTTSPTTSTMEVEVKGAASMPWPPTGVRTPPGSPIRAHVAPPSLAETSATKLKKGTPRRFLPGFMSKEKGKAPWGCVTAPDSPPVARRSAAVPSAPPSATKTPNAKDSNATFKDAKTPGSNKKGFWSALNPFNFGWGSNKKNDKQEVSQLSISDSPLFVPTNPQQPSTPSSPSRDQFKVHSSFISPNAKMTRLDEESSLSSSSSHKESDALLMPPPLSPARLRHGVRWVDLAESRSGGGGDSEESSNDSSAMDSPSSKVTQDLLSSSSSLLASSGSSQSSYLSGIRTVPPLDSDSDEDESMMATASSDMDVSSPVDSPMNTPKMRSSPEHKHFLKSPEWQYPIESAATKIDVDADDDDSEDEDGNAFPCWTQKEHLLPFLSQQYLVDPDVIFGSELPTSCDLVEIFSENKSKIQARPRTSSAIWSKDKLTIDERKEYKRRMGFILASSTAQDYKVTSSSTTSSTTTSTKPQNGSIVQSSKVTSSSSSKSSKIPVPK